MIQTTAEKQLQHSEVSSSSFTCNFAENNQQTQVSPNALQYYHSPANDQGCNVNSQNLQSRLQDLDDEAFIDELLAVS